MAEKTIKTRIIHKHDIEANWNLATNFTPKQGEIIVYDVDAIHAYERFKIGDGVTNVNSLPFSYSHIDKKLDKATERVDYTYLPKYRSGASPSLPLLHFGGISESSTKYQIAHLSEVIDPSAAYFVKKTDREIYIKPELITEDLKTKYHVSSGEGDAARYYIQITDEQIVLEYYIRSTEAYYYLHTSADSLGTIEEVFLGKAQNLIDDSYTSYNNLWSAQKTKEYTDAHVLSANYTVPIVDSSPTTYLPTEQGQMYMEERTNKFYIAVDAGGLILWKEVQFSGSGSSGQSITYTLSISGNVITLTGSDGSTSPITLPVYNGGVS